MTGRKPCPLRASEWPGVSVNTAVLSFFLLLDPIGGDKGKKRSKLVLPDPNNMARALIGNGKERQVCVTPSISEYFLVYVVYFSFN